jgi:hypothetical protein
MVPLGHARRHQDGKNMKKLGIAAAILLVALLMTGVVSALDTAQTTDGQPIKVRTMHLDNVTQVGDHWMIQSSELKTVTTSDGHVFKVIFHDINKETPFGTKGGGSRSLASGIMDIWGSYSWTAGYSVSESASWTPANQNVYLGIIDNVRGTGPSTLNSGGSGSFSTSVPWTSSDWGYAIANPGPQTIQYTLTF